MENFDKIISIKNIPIDKRNNKRQASPRFEEKQDNLPKISPHNIETPKSDRSTISSAPSYQSLKVLPKSSIITWFQTKQPSHLPQIDKQSQQQKINTPPSSIINRRLSPLNSKKRNHSLVLENEQLTPISNSGSRHSVKSGEFNEKQDNFSKKHQFSPLTFPRSQQQTRKSPQEEKQFISLKYDKIKSSQSDNTVSNSNDRKTSPKLTSKIRQVQYSNAINNYLDRAPPPVRMKQRDKARLPSTDTYSIKDGLDDSNDEDDGDYNYANNDKDIDINDNVELNEPSQYRDNIINKQRETNKIIRKVLLNEYRITHYITKAHQNQV
ncbi:MAG: hypothetical protein EZS28_024119 [Streblomastix strix]|uniref:Uncharacterized protein n=1 Tax=Streblomastix strix TaxID=222440 RepID=A0A5J4VD97_9EUKA|nr:MAG: hypothetical protein EZS28_024119 [Streblomastix strix]